MLVPREYTNATKARGRPPDRVKGLAQHPPPPKDASKPKSDKLLPKKTAAKQPLNISVISPATPSQPVVIPTRSRRRRQSGRQSPRACETIQGNESAHDAAAVPASVATLLALASLPEPAGRSKPKLGGRPNEQVKLSKDGILDHKALESGQPRMSNANPQSWDVLLSPPEEAEAEVEVPAPADDLRAEHRFSVGSLSSESMPSLETDFGSTDSASSPSTPGSMGKARSHRDQKQRLKSSSVIVENSNIDHPLLGESFEESEDAGLEVDGMAQQPPMVKLASPNRSTFKSNLTASFRLLKSAARSVSNFATPYAQRDADGDLHPTSLGPARFTDEQRPLPWAEPPDPALRRYLNPITLSPAEMQVHRDHNRTLISPTTTTTDTCTASIQMQTYQKGAVRSKNASSPPILVSSLHRRSKSAEPAVMASTPRQREPRENSDFLRVVVLEMNMRKRGTLGENAPGRARLWLPARQNVQQADVKRSQGAERWVPRTIEPEDSC
ncbi:MAG: hypothetical protein LQ342_002983 [Letrouitia transgressa]|nr:MAG: hypothetical protein LQ342_002983 [Letrouitia transgressa]